MNRYIIIDPETLQLSLVEHQPASIFAVPTTKSLNQVTECPFHGIVYFNVLCPLTTERDKEGGRVNAVAKGLVAPDPWLVAIAGIMWEGLLQGMPGDRIKQAVLKGLAFLKLNHLAPTDSRAVEVIAKEHGKQKAWTELGFSWRQFSSEGEPLNIFFCLLARTFEKKTPEERLSVLRPKPKVETAESGWRAFRWSSWFSSLGAKKPGKTQAGDRRIR